MKAKKLIIGLITCATVVGVTTICYNYAVDKSYNYTSNGESVTVTDTTTNSESTEADVDISIDASNNTISDSDTNDYAVDVDTPALETENTDVGNIEEIYKVKIVDVSTDSINLLPILRVVNDGYLQVDKERKFRGSSPITYGSLVEVANKLGGFTVEGDNKPVEYSNNIINLGVTLPNNSIIYNISEFNSNVKDKMKLRHAKEKDTKSGNLSYEPISGVDIWMSSSQASDWLIKPEVSPLQLYLYSNNDIYKNDEVFNCYMNKGMVLQVIQYLDFERLGLLDKNKDELLMENIKIIKEYIYQLNGSLPNRYTDEEKYLYDKLSFSNYPSYEYCKARGLVGDIDIDELDSLITKEEFAVIISNFLDADLSVDIANKWLSGDFTNTIRATAHAEMANKEETEVEDSTGDSTVDTGTGEITTDVNMSDGGN